MPKICAGVFPLTPEREAEQRVAVIAEAKTWLRTPYRQHGASKGSAVDCAMLMVRCWVDAGIFEEFDPRPYPPNWHLHRKDERYLAWVESLALETDEPRPGDIVLFRFGQCFSHSGILISPTRIIHSYVHWNECVMTDLSEVELFNRHEGGKSIQREKKFFDVWAKIRAVGAN